MSNLNSDNLRLTDFMDLPTLQEIQDSFSSMANVKVTITDADGNRLTQATPTTDFLRRQQAIEAAEESVPGPMREGREFVAPIIVNNQRLGTLRMHSLGAFSTADDAKLQALAEKLSLDPKQLKQAFGLFLRQKNTKSAAIQFLFLLANAVARLCFQEFQLRQRINELTAVYNVSMLMADARDLNRVLNRTVEMVAQIMEVKACAIRLIDRERDELVMKAVYNLSQKYLGKGAIRLSSAEIDMEALGPAGYCYVRNAQTDPRIDHPQHAAEEGIVSTLSVGMRYKGESLGVLRVYTAEEQNFSPMRIDLLKAIGAQAAAAIDNARLLAESIEADRLEEQVKMAADVQRRLVPQKAPVAVGLDLASIYVPCYELGGDFLDFITLPDDNMGLVVADVAGKGIPASLIMASVRAALRAQVDNHYYLYEVMRRVNQMVCHDTEVSEFITALYGVLDPHAKRFTYCNAGHPPGMLLRNGEVTELPGGNMVLGVDPEEPYTQSFIELKSGDALLLYTDGLIEAMNFQNELLGRHRVVEAFAKGGRSATEIAENVRWAMQRFVGLRKQSDDVSLIVARIL
jgi:serine phosphatase RsbU (regulator of sigma subunit)